MRRNLTSYVPQRSPIAASSRDPLSGSPERPFAETFFPAKRPPSVSPAAETSFRYVAAIPESYHIDDFRDVERTVLVMIARAGWAAGRALEYE